MARPQKSACLVERIQTQLAAVADPSRAGTMQSYMRSAMPFLGVSTPKRRAVTKALFRAHVPPTAAAWRAQVAEIWRAARFREERYSAIDWCRYARATDRARGRGPDAFHDLAALPLFERLIVEGAWWDFVDEVGGHQLGVLVRKFPGRMNPRMRNWARCANLWKRRAAILSQLDLKAATDTQLLADCIEPSLEDARFSGEFFIRKGIGWALRQYARTDPVWVKRFVASNRVRLSGLSRREALKHLA
jgi:3-methyladenine DNA glycosylase AlkD